MLFIYTLTVFVLACFIGYYVVLKVTPALHSPLMSVTNAISSVVIIAGIMAAGIASFSILGFIIVLLATINIVGGFMLTHRMLSMFSSKSSKKTSGKKK